MTVVKAKELVYIHLPTAELVVVKEWGDLSLSKFLYRCDESGNFEDIWPIAEFECLGEL